MKTKEKANEEIYHKAEKLETGDFVHVNGWNKACFFKVHRIRKDGIAVLRTVKTDRIYRVPVEDLLFTHNEACKRGLKNKSQKEE